MIEKKFNPSGTCRRMNDFFSDATLPLPAVSSRYATDEEFWTAAPQRRQPVFSYVRCLAIPDHFPVEQAAVGSLLTNGRA